MSNTESPGVNLTPTVNPHVWTLRFIGANKMNVLTPQMLEDLAARVHELPSIPDVRVLIFAGGPANFSAGVDLDQMRSVSDEDYRAFLETEFALMEAIERLPLITVAAINGAWIGNSAELALACDYRVVNRNSKFGLPEVRVGFIAPAQRLCTYIGRGKATEILYESKILDAESALALGLVTAISEEPDAYDAATQMAERYASLAPVAVRVTKAAIQSAYGEPGRLSSLEIAGAYETFKSADFREGSAAILERRAPQFAGL